jgi:hypothetical protein
MAIKGKGKTRSRRMVAAPPRPQLVVRKKPLLLRTSTRVVVLVVVLAGIAFGGLRWWDGRQAADLKSKELAGIENYTSLVVQHLPVDRQAQQGTGQVSVFTTLASALDQIQQGGMSPPKIRTLAKNFGADAQKSAEGMSSIKTSQIIPDTYEVGLTPQLAMPGITQLTLTDAQTLMADSFKIYTSIGKLMEQSADTPVGPARTALVVQMKGLQTTAADLFNKGYNKLLQIRFTVGAQIPSGLQPAQPGQVSPSPSASAKKKKKNG